MADQVVQAELDPVVKTWDQRYIIAESNQAPLFARFETWYDQFNAYLSDDYAPWRSKVSLPLLAGRTWSLISKLASGSPGWTVKPRVYTEDEAENAQVSDAARANEIKLQYDYRSPEFDDPMETKLAESLIDAAITGTGLALIPWCVKTQKVNQRVVKDGNLAISNGKYQEKVTQRRIGYNELIPISIFHVFVPPLAKNPQSADWMIVKSFVPMDELKAKVNADGTPYYKNLDQIEKKASPDDQSTYENARMRLLGEKDLSSSDQTVDAVEIWTCFEKSTNTITEVANRKVAIRKDVNPYWHGRFPVVRFQLRPRPQKFWGYGFFEITESLQDGANDIFNHYLDNLQLSLDGMLMHSANTELEDYIVQPGGEITYQGAEPPTQMKFPEPNPNGMRIALEEIQKGIIDNTISPYLAGTPADQTDQTQGTATGVKLLQNNADDVLTFMRNCYLRSIHEIGRQWLSNNQQYLDRDIWVSVTKHGVDNTLKVSPESIQGEFDLVLDDKSMAPLSKEEDLQQYMTWLQQMMQLKQMAQADIQQGIQTLPLVINYAQIAREMSEKYGVIGLDRFVADDKTAEQALQSMFSLMQFRWQHPSPQDRILEKLDYNQAPASIQAQIESQLGFQPATPEERQQTLGAAKVQQLQSQAAGKVVDSANTIAQFHQGADQQSHQQGVDMANLQHSTSDQLHKQSMDHLNLAQQTLQPAQGTTQDANGPQNGSQGPAGAAQSPTAQSQGQSPDFLSQLEQPSVEQQPIDNNFVHLLDPQLIDKVLAHASKHGKASSGSPKGK